MHILIISLSVQFKDIKSHGTKVVIYDLWMNDDGLLELDFDDDDEVNIPAVYVSSTTHYLHILVENI